jgi:hypothetical protein
MTPDHPLAELIAAMVAGRYPAADGSWRRVPPWHPEVEGIFAFTGHAVLALAPDIPDRLLVSLGVDGFGGAHDPRLITALAGFIPLGSLQLFRRAGHRRGTAASHGEPGGEVVEARPAPRKWSP